MVSQNFTKKTSKRERAAALVAEDRLTDEDIADELEITRRTLANWKKTPTFQARVDEIVEEVKAALIARGILDRQNRLNALNDRQKRMTEVIRQRAENLKEVPGGGNTGLLVRQVKGIGKGEDFQVVEEYAVDTGLLREMREHEKQAAIELGEWTEKREHSFDFSNLSDEELKQLERITSKLT
jgi:putative insertion element HTH domain-containing protein